MYLKGHHVGPEEQEEAGEQEYVFLAIQAFPAIHF